MTILLKEKNLAAAIREIKNKRFTSFSILWSDNVEIRRSPAATAAAL